ncbi:MAG: YidC/Oxa1 family membrane protein insertase [Mailhella sp.]|nr:YidC/Oxa1 family membrane protein insertase [Mailhella sp.]
MLELLYLVCIAPLEFCMQIILRWGFYTTASYGLALILMSLAVNTVILPIYNKVEGWQEEERALKARMAPMETMIREVFKGQERFAMISTLYRQHGYSQFMTLRASIGVLLQIPFFFAAYHLLSNMEALHGVSFGPIRDLGAPDELFVIGGFSINVLPILMTVVNLVSAFFYTHDLSRRDKIQLYGMAALFLVLLYNSPAALTFYWTLNNVYSLGKNIVEKDWMKRQGWKELVEKCRLAGSRAVSLAECSFVSVLTRVGHLFPFRLIPWSTVAQKWNAFLPASQKNALAGLFLPSAALLALLVIVYCPFAVFSSDPVLFDTEAVKFASAQIGLFFALLLILAVLGVLAGPLRWILGTVIGLLACVALVFCFVLAPDFGAIDALILQNPAPLYKKSNLIIDIAVVFSLLAAFVAVIRFRKAASLSTVIYAALTIVAVMSAVHYQSAKSTLAALGKDKPVSQPAEKTPPQYMKDFYTFSKNGKNVVVVMLDMFTGGNMAQILEIYPELKTQLDGFVWYEDTVTAGTSTLFGKPGIFSGEDCHPVNLNKDESRTLEEKIANSQGRFLRKIQEKGFRISVLDGESFYPDRFLPMLAQGKSVNFVRRSTLWPEAPQYWARKNNFIFEEKKSHDKFLGAIGLFNIAPLSVKKKIYRNGRWLNAVSVGGHSLHHSLTHLAALDALPEGSQVSDTQENAYIYMVNMLTHVPWGLDEKGMPSSDSGTSASRDPASGLSRHHIRTEAFTLKSLVRWFEWMKAQGVYDNTQIILVSDHGRGDSGQVFKVWGRIPSVHLHGLLLVKEAGERGSVRIDSTSQMANWDVPTIIFNALAEKNENIQKPWMNKNRERYHVRGDINRSRHSKNKFSFHEVYKIQGPLYEKKSWVKIQ